MYWCDFFLSIDLWIHVSRVVRRVATSTVGNLPQIYFSTNGVIRKSPTQTITIHVEGCCMAELMSWKKINGQGHFSNIFRLSSGILAMDLTALTKIVESKRKNPPRPKKAAEQMVMCVSTSKFGDFLFWYESLIWETPCRKPILRNMRDIFFGGTRLESLTFSIVLFWLVTRRTPLFTFFFLWEDRT